MVFTMFVPRDNSTHTTGTLAALVAYDGTARPRGLLFNKRTGNVRRIRPSRLSANHYRFMITRLTDGDYVFAVSERRSGGAVRSADFRVALTEVSPARRRRLAGLEILGGQSEPYIMYPADGEPIQMEVFWACGTSDPDPISMDPNDHTFTNGTVTKHPHSSEPGVAPIIYDNGWFFLRFELTADDNGPGYSLTVKDEDGDPDTTNDITVDIPRYEVPPPPTRRRR